MIKDKVALVTGGGTGIGRAIALSLADQGVNVVIASRNSGTGIEVVKEIEKNGGTAEFVQTDLTDIAQIDRMIDKTLQRFGKIHILINNAGQTFDLPLAELSVEDWNRCFDLNVRAVFWGSRQAIPHIKQAGGGSIINISSQVGLVGVAGAPAYAAAKAAVISLTKSTALDLARQGIRVNCICPGGTLTPIAEKHFNQLPDPEAALKASSNRIPLGRMGRPEDMAAAVLYLVSESASFVTGAVLLVDGGRLAGIPG